MVESGTVTVPKVWTMYTRYDVIPLERIVGTKRTERIMTGKRELYMLQSS